jgi:hypothetical protein
MPGAGRTRSLACKIKKHTSIVTTGSAGAFRHSPPQWFYGFLRALPGVHDFSVTVTCGSQRVGPVRADIANRQV